MSAEKACKSCKRIVRGNVCPVCKKSEFTRNWKGIVYVADVDSEIAKKLGITAPGKYALRTR